MKKITFKLLALTLCLAMVLTVQPLQAIALPVSEDDAAVGSEAVTEANGKEEAYILKEIEEKREENVKHFLMSDGSYMAAQYDIPVHFRDEEGDWQQYDNSLRENESLQEELINKKSDITVGLSKKAKQNKLVSIVVNGYDISWGFEKANNSPVEYSDTNSDSDSLTELENITEEVWYRNVYKNVDLQYFITPTGIKENIVLKNKNAQNEFVQNYKIGSLKAVQVDSKTIELRDAADNIIYTIKAPLMTDAADNKSDAVSLSIIKNNGNNLTVKITADAEWLGAEERKFPVYVDPWVETKQTTNTIQSASLFSNNVAATGYPFGSLYIGYESSAYGNAVSVVKTELPTLSAGDMVVKAQLALRQRNYRGSKDVQVNVSKMTTAWTQTDFFSYTGTITAKYSTYINSKDSKIEDFNLANSATLSSANDGNLTYWDITSVVKGWYNGEANNGVMLWPHASSSGDHVMYVRADDYGNYGNTSYPIIFVSYVNNNGLEDYWTYHDFSVTSRGSAYVNDYTGNLVVTENIFSATGSRLPMNISLTYNLRNYNKKFGYGASAGYGFMFNFQQRIVDVTDQGLIDKGYKYIYIDGDGTEHYFRLKEGSTTEWVDEEGLGLTLKTTGDSGAGMYLHYKDGMLAHFYASADSGILFFLRDNYGNKIRYYEQKPFGDSYGFAITSIADNAGRAIYLSYELVDGIMRIKTITDNENRVYTFTYDSSDSTLLKSITYPDNTVTTFTYSGKRLCQIEDSLGQKTVFTFAGSSSITATQIASVTSYLKNGSDYTELGRISFAYNKNNTTTITDSFNTQQTYQFDNFGRTTSIRYPDGTISNVTYNPYTGGKLTGSSAPASTASNNKIKSQSTSEKYVKNYVTNSSAELDSNYYISCWEGISADAHSYDYSVSYLGNRSFKICNNEDNEYFNIYAQQMFTTDFADSDFTFSAYAKTENVVAQSTHGAGLILHFYDSSGASLGIIYGDYYLTGTNDWTRMSVSGHAPAGTAEVRVYCGLMYASGTAWFDCLQLEKNPVMNDYNAVENSDFTKVSGWSSYNLASTDSYTGNGKITITGQSTVNKHIYQDISVNKADVCFKVFVTIDGVLAAQKENRFNGLELRIAYADGTYEYPGKSFNEATTGEQSISFTAKPQRAGAQISSVRLYYIVKNTANTCNLKNVMVTFDEQGTSYTYDSNGNLISAADNAERNQAYEYTDANELKKQTNNQNESYEYFYDSQKPHQLNAARSNQLGNGYTYTYDSYGNITDVKIGEVSADGTLNTDKEYISSSTTYNSAGTYVQSETDARNLVTTYDINSVNGLLNSITSPATVLGTDQTVTTSYTYYDDSRLIKSVSSGGSSVVYTYDSKRRLDTVTANSMVYKFEYDNYGNRTAVKLKGINATDYLTLITYTYAEPRKGLVTTATYGNGKTISYEYDQFDRLTVKTVASYQQFMLYYNNKGLLARTEDPFNEQSTDYIYDISGRLVQEVVYGYRNTISKYSYDNMSRVTSHVSIAGGTTEETYTYGADSLLTSMEQNGSEYTYTYDHLNRLQTKTIEISEGKSLKTEYVYLSGTQLVSEEKQYINNVLTETLSYTYDNWGNIKTISKNGTQISAYTYDSLNQLKTETKGTDTYEYTYDNGGNILNVKLNGTVTDTYTYGDANWPDKLTAHNGTSITYDSLGNPSSYYTGLTFGWTQGRKLGGISKGSKDYNCIYNEKGQAIYREVIDMDNIWDTYREYYIYDGDRLAYQSIKGTSFRFFYDEAGNPSAITINGTKYFYLKNIQGDVTGMVDTNGNVVARYTYDAWGKILSVTDGVGNNVANNASHIANLNPIRYRGYYYEAEFNLYNLGSRHYDPYARRFISADGVVSGVGESVQGYNLYAYCFNNPVNMTDPDGNWPKWATKVVKAVAVTVVCAAVVAAVIITAPASATAAIVTAVTVGAVVGCTSNIVKQTVIEKKKLNEVDFSEVLESTAMGGASAAIATTPIPVSGQIISNAMLSTTAAIIDEKSINSAITSGFVGGFSGYVGSHGARYNLSSPLLDSKITEAVNSAIAKGVMAVFSFESIVTIFGEDS